MILQDEGYKFEWFNFRTIDRYLIAYVKTRGKNIDKDE
jgi:hypothetical protein